MYSIVVRHLHNLQSDPLDKSSTHLTPYIVITVLLTILTLITVAILLNLFNFLSQTPFHLATISLSSLSVSFFQFCLLIYFGFQIPHIREIIWH